MYYFYHVRYISIVCVLNFFSLKALWDSSQFCHDSHTLCTRRKRDKAHLEIKNIFFKVIQKRRKSGEKVDDMLQTLIDATYK